MVKDILSGTVAANGPNYPSNRGEEGGGGGGNNDDEGNQEPRRFPNIFGLVSAAQSISSLTGRRGRRKSTLSVGACGQSPHSPSKQSTGTPSHPNSLNSDDGIIYERRDGGGGAEPDIEKGSNYAGE